MQTTPKKPEQSLLFNEDKKKFLTEQVQSVLQNGTPLYKVRGMSKQQLENLYAVAYNLYSAEQYEEAGKLFRAMTLLNYTDKKSWLGAAACLEMLKKYDKAIAGYFCAFSLDPLDPLPALHLFDCHLALKNYPAALSSLEMVILRCSKKTEYADIKKRAESLRNTLSQAIKESKTVS